MKINHRSAAISGLVVLILLGASAVLVWDRRTDPVAFRQVARDADLLPVVASWSIDATNADADGATLVAHPSDGSGEETVRKGISQSSVAATVEGYKLLAASERPDVSIRLDVAVTVRGSSDARELEMSYATAVSGRTVRVWSLDLFAHAATGEDIHIVLVNTDEHLVTAAATPLASSLQLGGSTPG